MKEFYLKQVDFVDEIRKIADKIKFLPPESKQILLNWLDSITTDWPISRRRYYGTEIPIWYCKNCGKPVLPEPGKYYQPWREPPPFTKCPHCGSTKGFTGEWRTLDTWMDSSITALAYIGYMQDEELFRKAFPSSLRPQGKDIVRTWLYYTLLRVYQLTGKPAFKYVWISGMVVDEKGEAMHKSKGNIVWPKPLIEKYGSDALRLFGVLEASHGSDIRYSEERLKGTYKFLTKLWNISRFISMFPIVKEDDDFSLQPSDKWILGLLNEVIHKAKTGYDNFNFHIPAVEVRNFVWNIFAAHYIEMVKPRAYNREGTFTLAEQKAAWYTLHTVLKTILKLLAPITPMITEKIYQEIYQDEGDSIHLTAFPEEKSEWKTELIKYTEKLTEVNSEIWKFKKSLGKSLKEGIKEVWLTEDLKDFGADLKAMHHIEMLKFGTPKDIEGYQKLGEKTTDIYVREK
ncbi:MAG: class I tRNA ligase family protein [Candidatus Asgardarchaeia archaeon]